MHDHADLVFLNGTVLTLDAGFSVASALAAAGGMIAAVGDRSTVAPLIGAGTRVVDLRGRTLLPGINDSHLHGCLFGLENPPLSMDLTHPNVTSIADVAQVVGAAAETRPHGEWITGSGWDPGYLAECVDDSSRQPTRFDLDAVSPDHPVALDDFSRHTAWLNTAGLRRAGIDRDTVPPHGGVIVTDAAGEPTGLLLEGAKQLAEDAVPPLSTERRTEAIRVALARIGSLGITSYTEPGLGPGGDPGGLGSESLAAYGHLLASGELSARVSVLLLPTPVGGTAAECIQNLETLDVPVSHDRRRLRIIGVKLFADGIPPNKTAWMHEEYVGGGRGGLCVAGETDDERVAELQQMITYAHTAGYQVGVHVTGDRGIDTVVDAFVAAATAHPRPDPRHYLVHGDFLSHRSMKALAEHGFGVNMNPNIKWTIADLEEQFVGVDRAAYEWPYRDALDAGVTVTSGSDAPLALPDWRQGVATMLLRESKASGRVSGADQRIGLVEALRTYTVGAAWQDFAEDWKGSLEVGKVADVCVLDGDLLHTDPHDIPDMPVALTAVGGDIVHDSLS